MAEENILTESSTEFEWRECECREYCNFPVDCDCWKCLGAGYVYDEKLACKFPRPIAKPLTVDCWMECDQCCRESDCEACAKCHRCLGSGYLYVGDS